MAIVTNGEVISITVSETGTGYTNVPDVFIGPPLGIQVGIVEAVAPTFSGLTFGSNYQLQSSSDLLNWTNQGPPFTATNSVMVYPQYFNVMNFYQYYFRLTDVSVNKKRCGLLATSALDSTSINRQRYRT
jgi:hypothetical protein